MARKFVENVQNIMLDAEADKITNISKMKNGSIQELAALPEMAMSVIFRAFSEVLGTTIT